MQAIKLLVRRKFAKGTTLLDRIKRWAARLKQDVVALSLALEDPEVSLGAKAVIAFVVAYALSPIDLVPDFIPVVGYLDDLLILPFGIALAIRMIGSVKMAELRSTASQTSRPKRSLWGAAVVIMLWIALLGAFVYATRGVWPVEMR